MRGLVLVSGALMLTACGSTATAPVESGSGQVASADACPEGPPARGSLTNGRYEADGVVGTVTNNTGAAVWISNDAPKPSPQVENEVHRTPCLLDTGQSVAYASSTDAIIYVSSTPTSRTGTRVELRDPLSWYPNATVTGFREPFSFDNSSCGADSLDSTDFSEDESRDFEATNGAGYTGRVSVLRLPDDETAANEYTGQTRGTDDWARMDVTITKLGSCS